ncbi:MAG: hypothetical protein KDK70_35915, partial [Myxococcales bacterium]|nr:hypothetical protein [Myxococcales bacterium]
MPPRLASIPALAPALLALLALLGLLAIACGHRHPRGRMDYVELTSRSEGRPLRYGVYTPPGWDHATPLPLVVLLHGAGDDETSADRAIVTERLDAARFVVWLEVLLEGGDAAAARRLRELPEELLTAGLCAQLFVLERDALGHDLAGASWEEAEVAERVLDEALHLELSDYTLVARHDLGWDACIAALLAPDVADHDRVQRVLVRCCQATREELHDEDDGL